MLVLIFIAIIMLTGTITLVGAYFLTRRNRLKVEQRINMVARTSNPHATGPATGRFKTKILHHVNDYVKGIFAWGMDSHWGIKSGSGKLMLIAIVSATTVWFVIRSAFEIDYLITVAICVVTAYYIPHRLLLKEQRKAERKFNEQFPDAVDTVARMLRAGMPATAAMRTVGEDAPEPVGQVFRTISDQMRIGIPLSEALAANSQKINLPDFRFFTVTVNLQYSTGGNLVFTLESLASVIRKRRAVRAKATAMTSEIRMSAYVLGSLPFLTLSALLIIQPDYLSPLIYDPRGHIILAMAAGGLLMSMITMKKMMNSVTNG